MGASKRVAIVHPSLAANPGPSVRLEAFAELVSSLLAGVGGHMTFDSLDAHPQVTSHPAFRHLGSSRELAKSYPAHFLSDSSMFVVRLGSPFHDQAVPATALGLVTRLVLAMEARKKRRMCETRPRFATVGSAADVVTTYPTLFKLSGATKKLKAPRVELCAPAAQLLLAVIAASTIAPPPPPAIVPSLDSTPTEPAPPEEPRASLSPPHLRTPTLPASMIPTPPHARTPTVPTPYCAPPPSIAPTQSTTLPPPLPLMIRALAPPRQPPPPSTASSNIAAGLGPPHYFVPGRAFGWRISTAADAQASFRALTVPGVTRIALAVVASPGSESVQLAYVPGSSSSSDVRNATAHVFVWELGNAPDGGGDGDKRIMKMLLRELLWSLAATGLVMVIAPTMPSPLLPMDSGDPVQFLQAMLEITVAPQIVVNTQVLAVAWTTLSWQAWNKLAVDGASVRLAMSDMGNIPWNIFTRIAPPVLLSRQPDTPLPLNTLLWATGKVMNWHREIPPGVDLQKEQQQPPNRSAEPEMMRFEARLQDVDQLLQAEATMADHIAALREYLNWMPSSSDAS
ncbi:hypothetical protein BC828DRAFT_264230 [Blastocladiella britannica]|nr:hypothetical protein BC828DRAFT_264230 [Blastocladiella britannica]